MEVSVAEVMLPKELAPNLVSTSTTAQARSVDTEEMSELAMSRQATVLKPH